MPSMHHQEEDEQWREEDESSSAVETGCCSSQSIPILAHALSLFNSFPTPHDGLFGSGPENGMGMVEPGAAAGLVCPPAAGSDGVLPDSSSGVARCLIPVESCAKNEEENKSKNNHNSGNNNDQHKKIRSKNWTRLEMLKLIRLRTDYEPKFAGGGKKMELWDEISDALNREGIGRDGQQCRDKWEKLCAGYKEVRDGNKLKEDFTLFDVLHPLLSGKVAPKKLDVTTTATNRVMHVDDEHHQHAGAGAVPSAIDNRSSETFYEDEVVLDGNAGGDANPSAGGAPGRGAPRKKRRLLKYVPVTDVTVVQSLLETVVAKQQRFFRDLLESMERREQLREQARQEREDQWRAEDRAQRAAFNNAMICLAQKLVGNSSSDKAANLQLQQPSKNVQGNLNNAEGGQKKRSKNWKRAEVLQLIRLRGEMDMQFTSGTRRAAVWDELSEALMSQGIARDGKQCREKWDKLTAAYKDVTDGIKEPGDMPYYAELSAALKRPVHVDELKTSLDARAGTATCQLSAPGFESGC